MISKIVFRELGVTFGHGQIAFAHITQNFQNKEPKFSREEEHRVSKALIQDK